jgi:hydrogenase expression/formation protein HypE
MTHEELKARYAGQVITMAHGSGGKAMQKLIEEVILFYFGKPNAGALEDQATLSLQGYEQSTLALTTDSYVVTPLFFAGGSIGHLAINGTVNDLAVSGAIPRYLTCGLILEEGLPYEVLIDVLADMADAAQKAGVAVVTGDTKVVERGSCDQLFINTAGVGFIPAGRRLSIDQIQVGDKLVINGSIGDHGVAIMVARGELSIESSIASDCAPLNDLIQQMLTFAPNIRAMRDITRGGLATVLNEYAQGAQVSIQIEEAQLPIREDVKGFCEVLGLDPLYLANEGKLLAVVPADEVEAVLAAMHSHPEGQQACVIGEVVGANNTKVIMQSAFGGKRMVDMLVGDQLPRIC